MGRMKQLWYMLTEKELAGYVDKYDRNPIAIPLLVASCKKHGWDIYDPFQRVGFVAPTLRHAAALIRRKFTCPQCGAIHIPDVVLIQEHKVAVMDMYEFLRKAESEEEMEDYDDYEEEDYEWTDDLDLAEYEEPDWCDDWREEEEAEEIGW